MESTVPRSRRFLLGAAAGGLASIVASVLTRAGPAVSSEGATLAAGADTVAESVTRLRRTSPGPALVSEASGPGIGLVGTSPSGIGVYGIADDGNGILGSSASGTGVEARSEGGVALHVSRGRIKADFVSGIARVNADEETAVVRPQQVEILPTSFVLLTPMDNLRGGGLWVSTQPQERTFTIHVSPAPPEPIDVGWLLLG